MTSTEFHLLPQPRKIERLEGEAALPDMPADGTLPDVSTWDIEERIDAQAVPHTQGYRLKASPEGIRIEAADQAGAFYARQTLRQLAAQFADRGKLPSVRIEDWADFPARGVMLDISRDKVPTMSALFDLVRKLASWKVNQLQLYTEHTFAYAGHEAVWRDASPMTPDEIRELDRFCRRYFVELVPNQNSFGHMERWLAHDPYVHLAETTGSYRLPWGEMASHPTTLCPLDPGAPALLEELYGQLLPNFTSRLFNVGCDETWELGQGRSREACQEKGTERVYLDFLKVIHRLVSKHGRTMQFWCEILDRRPDLLAELPRDAIALEWGYEKVHPFEARTRRLAEAGLRFYVCPGTSSWCTLAGRTNNALANLRSAAEAGKSTGAEGYLITDWGDGGHLQPLPVSYLGFAYGAAVSWATEANGDLDIADRLSRYAFLDPAGKMGQLAYDLGNVYLKCGRVMYNESFLSRLLTRPGTELWSKDPATRRREGTPTVAHMREARAALDEAITRLDEMNCGGPDASLVNDEFRYAARLLRHATMLGEARLAKGEDAGIPDLPAATREELRADLEHRITEHRAVWLARNRLGGLRDSAGRSERVLAMYADAAER